MGRTRGRKWLVGAARPALGAILALVVAVPVFGQMPTAEQYMAACAREVSERHDLATATYLQRRFMVKTEGMAEVP